MAKKQDLIEGPQRAFETRLSRYLAPRRRRELTSQLVEGLAERGIPARAELEKSDLPGRYRLIVSSNAFERLLESERQELVWRVIQQRWPRDDQFRLTLTLTLSGKEAAGEWWYGSAGCEQVLDSIRAGRAY